MQTFLPFPNFDRSARALDRLRLGKQRVEAVQILNALDRRKRGERAGWQSHPAVLMWAGHEHALCIYHDAMIREWTRRGYRNNMPMLADHLDPARIDAPEWLGHERLHASHRWRLFEKDPDHYGALGFGDETPQPYFWPICH